MHVIELDSGGDITKAKVLRTLPNLPSERLVYVTNYADDAERAQEAEEVAEAVTAATAPILSRVEALEAASVAAAAAASAATDSAQGALDGTESNVEITTDDDASSTDEFEAMAMAGLALGLVGFLCGGAALGIVLSGRGGPSKPVQREISFDKSKGGISTTTD